MIRFDRDPYYERIKKLENPHLKQYSTKEEKRDKVSEYNHAYREIEKEMYLAMGVHYRHSRLIQKLWGQAYDVGHSAGFGEVCNEMEKLLDLFWDEINFISEIADERNHGLPPTQLAINWHTRAKELMKDNG